MARTSRSRQAQGRACKRPELSPGNMVTREPRARKPSSRFHGFSHQFLRSAHAVHAPRVHSLSCQMAPLSERQPAGSTMRTTSRSTDHGSDTTTNSGNL